MATGSREQFKQYCLRYLGAPVVEINCADEQIEDRIDEALEYWRLYHHEGVEQVYLKQQIRASVINLTTPVADTFSIGRIVTGQTSGAIATVTAQSDRNSEGTTLLVRDVAGTFIAGESIVESTSNITATVGELACVLGEYDLKYIEVSDWVYGITRIIPFNNASASSSRNMFDVQYQLRLHDLYDLTSASVMYYTQAMSHLSLLDMQLNAKPSFEYNRLQNRIYPHINWEYDVVLGDYILFECYRGLNPAEFNRVWNEPWLKHYTSALIKRQWGQNLSKFGGIQLPGGVTLNGPDIYDSAMAEIKDLEEELRYRSAPLGFMMG